MSIKENNGYFSIKDAEWQENQLVAGFALSKALKEARSRAVVGISTAKLNSIIEEVIRDNSCHPTFLGYMGFPAASCISINKELVHGIPKDDVIIKDGDIIKIDAGATYGNSVADAAFTMGVGDVGIKNRMLIEQTEKALYNAINYIKDEISKKNMPTIGGVGHIIKKTASQIGANVILNYSGHGVENGKDVHWSPMVLNDGEKTKGPRIYPGMAFMIEPMIGYGNVTTKVASDNWTVNTESVFCHFEHSIFVTENSVNIVTDWSL